jgi:hypothetical protein
MSWLRTGKQNPDCLNLEVSVKIFEPVLKRAKDAISRSDLEEGGKLLGSMNQKGNKLEIEVISYLDSGPRVDNSSGHLMPDGEYQESVFRVLEKFTSDLDFLGSWHSHHCNGLKELSDGDIRGYLETVNSPQYDVNYFFAMLVTDLRGAKIDRRYYLFCRGQNNYYELDPSSVKIVRDSSPLEPILQSFEEVSFAYRRQKLSSYSHASQFDYIDNLQKIRIEDQRWISTQFPFAKALRSKKDASIFWRWPVNLASPISGEFTVEYTHPTQLDSLPARLEITHNGEVIIFKEILLNSDRFQQIEQCIDEAIQKVNS